MFGQYIVLHHLDDKYNISDRLGKQKFSILSSYGHLFWQFSQKCTFWDFWLKSGDFESKNLKIVHNTPYMGLFSKEITSRFEIFGSFWVLDCFGPFRIFWRPFLGILSIMTTLIYFCIRWTIKIIFLTDYIGNMFPFSLVFGTYFGPSSLRLNLRK